MAKNITLSIFKIIIIFSVGMLVVDFSVKLIDAFSTFSKIKATANLMSLEISKNNCLLGDSISTFNAQLNKAMAESRVFSDISYDVQIISSSGVVKGTANTSSSTMQNPAQYGDFCRLTIKFKRNAGAFLMLAFDRQDKLEYRREGGVKYMTYTVEVPCLRYIK